MALRIGVHQMRLHREAPAFDGVFARHVEVHLLQLEVGVVEADVAARLEVDLDRVPVVDHAIAVGPVVEVDARQLRRAGMRDVDGRLLVAGAARCESGLEPRPVRRALLAAVRPVRVLRLTRNAGHRAEHEQRQHPPRSACHGVDSAGDRFARLRRDCTPRRIKSTSNIQRKGVAPMLPTRFADDRHRERAHTPHRLKPLHHHHQLPNTAAESSHGT
nr:hypothetical protein [Lysobacter terrigena]